MDDKKKINLGLAILPIAAMLLLLVIGYGQLNLRIESLLLISAGIAATLAYWQGYRWNDIIDAIVAKLAKAMPVMMILICVGGLIGTWMFSGTIPYMVYWGLKLISPQYILIAAFFITSVISVCTGTSWGAAGTVGVALMGVADTDLYSHIQHLMYTTIPGFVLAAIVYFIAGHTSLTGSVATPEKVTDILQSLESLYHFNLLMILPPILVLWGAITKRPVIPVMLAGCALAIVLGIGLQGLTLKQGLNALIEGFNLSMFSDQRHNITGVVSDVPRLLNRGGMSSMMSTILLAFCAFAFAGALALTGALTVIINSLLQVVRTTGQLIAATLATTILVTGATCNGKLGLLIPAELFKGAYHRMGLDNKNLSRTIEDGCTVIEPLIPWTAAGIYMATTLGVSTLDLLPWAIQCYAAVFLALIYGFTGFGIARVTPENALNKKETQREIA
ncbi:Na+/H+ antiporter NhaC [Photorhabdus khanii]|uniref:Na+/H+ antiporter NhaC n=1 Tax=Photorhabdus khanii TaxID=1004150 RepID=A0A7C9KIL5_9GAMM|nr:Na+/H+ antiporter NhaC family protein [Photorhabdus khanii]MQL49265.1 Na+/H+ antiporter NhaC [Photorhabdus khanii]